MTKQLKSAYLNIVFVIAKGEKALANWDIRQTVLSNLFYVRDSLDVNNLLSEVHEQLLGTPVAETYIKRLVESLPKIA